jgi:hypothetical protein
MQVATQEKNTVVAQSRGYWGYEEIDSGKMEKIAGAGDGGDGGGCGCGCGDGDGEGACAGESNCSSDSDDNAVTDAAFDCFDAASFNAALCLAIDAFTPHAPAPDNGHSPAATDANGNATNGGIY